MSKNKYSRQVTQDETQPAAQAMLHAIGLSDEDLKKPQIGIASTGYQGNPCNMHLNNLSETIKKHLPNDLIGLIFHTIGVSDGISMGTSGMRYSLQSRDIIADSIETVMNAQAYDGLIAVVGCDKNMPGAMMSMGRLNRPAILVYGGTIASGNYKGRKLDIVSAFEALGEKVAGEITPKEFKEIIHNALPGQGACGGMYTANTMATAIETMGMSLPSSSSSPAAHKDKLTECEQLGRYINNLINKDLKPKDIVTIESINNALTMVMALGGSTNAVLHHLAIAHAFDIPLNLQDIQRISDKTPLIADLKPSGKYLMENLHEIGGMPAITKYMLKEGYLKGDCMTITGKSLAENLVNVEDLPKMQEIIYSVNKPIKKTGHLQILYGNLAEDGAVAKITGKEGVYFEGKARVFDSEYDCNDAIRNKEVQKGEVIVIRYEGPKGGPGMPEMLKPTALIMGANLGGDIALITDGRFSGGTHGFVVGHITPEAQDGGLLALVQNGDNISINAEENTISVNLTKDEIEKRKKQWQAPPLKHSKGTLYKYAKSVSSATKGCLTDL